MDSLENVNGENAEDVEKTREELRLRKRVSTAIAGGASLKLELVRSVASGLACRVVEHLDDPDAFNAEGEAYARAFASGMSIARDRVSPEALRRHFIAALISVGHSFRSEREAGVAPDAADVADRFVAEIEALEGGDGEYETLEQLEEELEADAKATPGKKKHKPTLPGWMAGVMLNADGWPYQNIYNTLWAIEHHPDLKTAFAFDEMSCVTNVHHDDGVARPITDQDVIAVTSHLQRNSCMASIGKHMVGDAIDQLAHKNKFHPVKEYLTNISWDETPRLDKMLHVYFGAADTNYSAGVGAMLLIAMVARVMRPGCKADYMPIFEGPQGKGKSRLCAILAGRWFSDSLPDLHSKDAAQHLRGKWLIEVAELDKMSRAETNTLKAFITRQDERYRPPYGRYEVHEPRQCLFVGTTNDSNYLKDETGARRFWPVACGELDFDGLTRDRDQLFAEALARFNGGEQWWPDGEFEATVMKPVQAERYTGDAWHDAIARYVERYGDGFSIAEVASGALSLPLDRLGMSEQMRVSKALKALGLHSKHTKKGNVWRKATSE